MKRLRFLMDMALPSSAGGELLKVELLDAVARTRPDDGELVVAREGPMESAEGAVAAMEVVAGQRRRGFFGKVYWTQRGAPELAKRVGADATFVACGRFSRRLWKVTGVVCTANNMVPFLAGETARRAGLRIGWRERLQRIVALRCLGLADRVVLHSRHAFRQLGPYLPELAAKTRVVLTGVPRGTRAVEQPGHPLGGLPYFLYFSAFKPYKNHLLLVEAYSRLCAWTADAPRLIFAGYRGSRDHMRRIKAAITSAGLEGRVEIRTAIDSSEVAAWLHHAVANVFASVCETNSLILAEIIGCGGVLAASDSGPAAEVAQDAGLFFDPFDADAAAGAMEALWRDVARREKLRARARARARELSWDECGAAFWGAAREAAEIFSRRRGRGGG